MAHAWTLHDAFLDELGDIYHAEKQLTKALPKMAKAASDKSLARAFQDHLRETEQHVARVERTFASLGESVKAKPCEGIRGIIAEGNSIMHEDFDDMTMDASLIAAAQRVEHYEMAAYGALIAWARTMQHEEAANLLQQNLDEEKAADEKLSALAEGGINQSAAQHAHSELTSTASDTSSGRRKRARSSNASGRKATRTRSRRM
jgi:ferritin-like metal-binding protein YciE